MGATLERGIATGARRKDLERENIPKRKLKPKSFGTRDWRLKEVVRDLPLYLRDEAKSLCRKSCWWVI